MALHQTNMELVFYANTNETVVSSLLGILYWVSLARASLRPRISQFVLSSFRVPFKLYGLLHFKNLILSDDGQPRFVLLPAPKHPPIQAISKYKPWPNTEMVKK